MKHSISCPLHCPACADADIVFCGGAAKPTDTHLASTVRCIDDEIIGWLKRREARQQKCKDSYHDQRN